MWRRDLVALGAFFRLGWRQAAAGQRAATFGRVVLLVLILCIFWGMWSATPLVELGDAHLTVARLFWYLAATETVAMSVGFPYRTVEADILSGELASSLSRPVDYVAAMLANWTGETTFRLIIVSIAAFACGVAMTHTVPFDVGTGVLLVIGLWLACLMVLVCQLAIGLLATWMKSAAPAFWIWQKLFFVLGGLIIPLSLYPGWLASIAKATPFAAMVFLPASLVFGATGAQVATLFVAQLGWLLVLALVAWRLESQVYSRLMVRGG
jgi:ABC-2 type transport system permease protein